MSHLIVPSMQYKDSFLEAIAEFHTEGRYEHLDIQILTQEFQAYVEDLLSRTERSVDRPGLVPESIFWLIDAGEYIGRVAIRHELTESLLCAGGNIGYDIRPSRRMRGYGKLILRLALVKARELSLSRVLVTCRPDNIGSWKIIEANGGILENEIDVERPDGIVRMRRYWIEIEK